MGQTNRQPDSFEKNLLRDQTFALQNELVNQGLKIRVDGMLGPETKAALKEHTGTDNLRLAKEAIVRQLKFTGETEEIEINGERRRISYFEDKDKNRGMAYEAPNNQTFIITFNNGQFQINALEEGPIKVQLTNNPTVQINNLDPTNTKIINGLGFSPQFSQKLLAMVGATRLPEIKEGARTIIANLPKEIYYWLDGLYSITFTRTNDHIEIKTNPTIERMENHKIPIDKLQPDTSYVVKEAVDGNPPTTLTPELVNELLKLS